MKQVSIELLNLEYKYFRVLNLVAIQLYMYFEAATGTRMSSTAEYT